MILDRLFPPQYREWLSNPPLIERFKNHEQLDQILNDWSSEGALVEDLGQSSQGRTIRAAVIGEGPRTLLAWGYPHPDEPLGSEALVWLGEGLLRKQIELPGWRTVIILCPDPDQVSLQNWLDKPLTIDNFTKGCWRPEHLGREIDYGFPIDWEEFYWPEEAEGSLRPDEANFNPETELPFTPLQESLILAEAIKRFRPDLVASMHSTHSGGDYTFLLQEEPRSILTAMRRIPESLGLQRHLGEPIDVGDPWLYDSPDLIRERGLDWFSNQLRSQSWFNDQYSYGGNHSAAAYLQSILPESQFICPESTLFRSRQFGSEVVLEETALWRQTGEQTGPEWTETAEVFLDERWIKVGRRSAGLRDPAEKHYRAQLTRGALGISAIDKRREALRRAEVIWQQLIDLPELENHPYRYEKLQMTTPYDQIDQDKYRLYTLSAKYRQPITLAQAQSFRGVWPIHTAAMLGGLHSMLQAQDQDRREIQQSTTALNQLYQDILEEVPLEMRQAGEIAPALQSMIARVLLCTRSDRYAEET